jgi:hypothetical protein
MKRFLLLAVLCVSTCVFAQYPTTWHTGVMDLTAYCTNSTTPTNCWKALGSISAYDADMGNDGTVAVLDNSYKLYFWDHTSTYSWVQQTAAGSGWSDMAVYDSTHIYLIAGTTPVCPSPNRPVYFYDGVHAPTKTATGCFTQIWVAKNTVSPAATLEARDASGTYSYSSDQGATWHVNSNLAGATGIFLADGTHYCKVVSNTLYTYTPDQGTAAFTPAPSGTITGCFWNPAPPDANGVMMVYSSSGTVQNYDFAGGIWHTVYTPVPIGRLYGYGKATVLGLQTGGQPYHYNVLGGYIEGVTSGNLNVCPGLGSCNGAVHTIHLRVQLPEGVGGSLTTVPCSPTVFCSGYAWDASAACDVLFGPSNDSNCTPTVPNEDVICSLTLANLGSGGTPPAPTYSEDYVTWNGQKNISGPYPIGPHGYTSHYICYVNGACATGTSAACPASDIHGDVISGTPSDSVSIAALQCQLGPWTTVSKYFPDIGSSSCLQFTLDKHAKVPGNCF